MTAPASEYDDAGERIEGLLAELRARTEPVIAGRVDELVTTLVGLYGEGLARIVSILHPEDAARLATDELVASLLVLHGLHPDGVSTRIEAALERARPSLASHAGGVTLLEVDEAGGVARLRWEGTCNGCASSAATAKGLLERAIAALAPEVSRVEFVERSEDGLVQLRRRP